MYRLQVKFSRGWKIGVRSYTTQEEAQARAEQLISLGQKRNGIKIVTETQLFS